MNFTQADFKQSQYYGYYVTPKSGNVNIRKYPGTKEAIITKMVMGEKGGTVMALYNKKVDDYSWYYIKLKEPVGGVQYGFVATSVIKVGKTDTGESTAPSQSSLTNNEKIVIEKAEKLIKEVADRDIMICKRLVVFYYVLLKQKEQGKNVDKQWVVLKAMAIRYMERQNKLKEIKNWQGVTIQLKDSLEITKFWVDYERLGIRSIPIDGLGGVALGWALIVTGVLLIGAGIALAVNRALEEEYSRQTEDIKLTGAFGKHIKNLPEGKEKEDIIKDVENQIDDAYEQGYKEGSRGSSWAWIKNGAIVVFSVWGFTKLLDMSESWRSKKNVGLRKT